VRGAGEAFRRVRISSPAFVVRGNAELLTLAFINSYLQTLYLIKLLFILTWRYFAEVSSAK
jgi:hypothetical protein